jgi:hypothetical protein
MRLLVDFETLYGDEGDRRTPYLTRLIIGRLRLHVFHRGDADPDPHDHPWDFWTFPLTPYVEEIATKGLEPVGEYDPWASRAIVVTMARKIVPAFRWSYRPAEYTHRVLGRYDEQATLASARSAFVAGAGRVPPLFKPGRIITIVWQGKSSRKWGFLRNRDGNWCWTPWREYVLGGGKHAPCEPEGGE